MKQTLSFLTVLFLLTACGGSSTDGGASQSADSVVVRVAVLPTLDCLPLYLASDHGMFQRAGINIALVDFTAQMDCDTAFANGSVEAMATDLVRLEWLQRQKVSSDILTTTDASWKLYTSRNSRIRQLRQLDDHMLAMTRYSATDMLAELVVDSARLQEERVFRIQVNDVAIRLNMIQNSLVDAALLAEPQATAARNVKVLELLDASDRFDLRLGVVAARNNTISSEQKKAFEKAYNEACDSLNEHGLQAYGDMLMKRMNVTAQTVDSLPEKYVFHHVGMPRQKDLDRVKNWMKEKLEKEDVEKQPIQ